MPFGTSCRAHGDQTRVSRSADERPTWTSRSGEVETVEVHDLDPRRDEVVHELLPRVIARVDLCERAQLGVRAEDEVDATAGPPELARCGVAALEHLRVLGRPRP